MADQRGLLEKESAAFASDNKPGPGARRNRSEQGHSVTAGIKPPEMDELLERTLNNINIAELLTKREAEILRLIVSGKTNKEIAWVLCRTERTVE